MQSLQQGQGLCAFSGLKQNTGLTQGSRKAESAVRALGGLAVSLGSGVVITVGQSALGQGHIGCEARGRRHALCQLGQSLDLICTAVLQRGAGQGITGFFGPRITVPVINAGAYKHQQKNHQHTGNKSGVAQHELQKGCAFVAHLGLQVTQQGRVARALILLRIHVSKTP